MIRLQLYSVQEKSVKFAPSPKKIQKNVGTHVFHHECGVASLSGQPPLEPQLGVQMRVLPVQQLLDLVAGLEIEDNNHELDEEERTEGLLTLLERQMTGHMEQPRVQQQQRQPQKSQRTLTGRVLRRVTLTRVMVALYSSGATRA